MKATIRSILLLTLLAGSGCSIALQSKPGTAKSASCSTSRVYPAIDAVMLGASIAAVVASVVKADDWGDGGTTLGGAGVMGAVLFTASGVNGIRDRRACRALHETPAPVATR